MIDTDKYEGHTPNEWIVEEGANGDTLVSSFHPNEDGLQTDIALIYTNQIDAQLIADAPRLLEEGKRGREQGKNLIEAAERVRSDISDEDTGWYYQLGNHIEKMNRLVKE